MKFRLPLAVTVALLPWALSAEALRLSVSDLLEPALAPTLEAWSDEGLISAVRFEGSLLGEAALREDDVELAILARPEAEAIDGLLAWPLAYYGVQLAVPQANPLAEIDRETLREIWRRDGTVAEWAQLGLEGVWTTREINLLGLESSNNLMFELFRARVLERFALTPHVIFEDDLTGLFGRMGDNPATLAMIPVTAVPGDVRVLRVAAREGAAAFEASADNMMVGDYDLRLSFVVAVRPAHLTAAAPVLRRLMNDAMAERLAAADLVALPATERREILLDLRAAQ